MSILFRSWVTFALVIAVVQGVQAILAVLQHDAILSDLARQRLSVVAQTTSASFRPIVDLGLPLSMMRNGNEVVARALQTDPQIEAVAVFNPSGFVVYSTEPNPSEQVSDDVLRALRLTDGPAWSIETGGRLFSGHSITDRAGDTVGAVVVAYPRDRYRAASRDMLLRTAQSALLIWAAFAALSYVVLRLLLAAPQRAIARLETSLENGAPPGSTRRSGAFGTEIARLETNLAAAARRFEAAWSTGSASQSADPPPHEAPTRTTRSLARRTAARLAPVAALLIVGSAVILGAITLANVNRSIEPELSARTNLIGTVVSDNVQRAVAAGVPLDRLTGAESYFGEMLSRLPEVAYIAVATGRIVLEAGERIDPYLAPPRERKNVRSHPILVDGEEIAYVVIDIDPAFIARRFRDVFLDMAVIVLVTAMIAYELMVLMTSRSLTGGLDRLQRLASMQAAGDFSMRVTRGARGTVDRLTATLVERAERLNAKIGGGGLKTLRVAYFTDIRLALFLFAAADELPLSFLPIYTRAASNSLPWLDESIVIGLPLAGYLLAILLASPYAGALAQRLGRRRLLWLAAVPMLAAHVGLFVATSVTEIVLWRTATGVGYALVTLACQDFALAVAPAGERDRTLGTFTTVLFGGVFCGTALGGILADRLGQANVFLISGVLIAVSIFLFLRLLAPQDAGARPRSGQPEKPRLFAGLRNPRFGLLVFGVAIPTSVLLQAFASYLVALTLDGLGASTADIGRTLMLFIALAVGGPVGGRVTERGAPPELVALVGLALAGLSLLAVVAWPGELAMLGAVLGGGLGYGLARGPQVSITVRLAETGLRALGSNAVLGALRTWERGGAILGLLVIAAISGTFGFAAATGLVAAWVLVGAALYATVAGGAVRQATAAAAGD